MCFFFFSFFSQAFSVEGSELEVSSVEYESFKLRQTMSVSSVIEYSLIDYQIVASGYAVITLASVHTYSHMRCALAGKSDDGSCQAWGQRFISLSSPLFWKSAEQQVIPRAVHDL